MHGILWGYAGVLASYLGIRGRVQFLFGGTPVSKG